MIKNKLLMVVDMQNDFVTGILGNENAEKIVPNVVAKVQEYVKNNDFIIFTQDSHQSEKLYLNTREGNHLPIPHCKAESEGWQIIPELIDFTELKNCILYEKWNQFGFTLDEYDLNRFSEQLNGFMDINEIEIIGLVTNLCVISVAICIQNVFNDSEITIDASCCASNDIDLHNKALDVMEGLQMKITNR